MQARDGGRIHNGIFGTRWEKTIYVEVQLSDTRISIGKRQGFFKESSLGENEQTESMGTESIDGTVGRKRGRKRFLGARGREGELALIKEEREAGE